MQHGTVTGRNARHEETEQQAEENQCQHVAFGGSLHHIGGHHAQKDAHYIPGTVLVELAKHGIQLGGIRLPVQLCGQRLASHQARLDQVDQYQPQQDGGKAAGQIEGDGLDAHAGEVFTGTHATDPGDDRGHHQWHNQHHQCAQEEGAEKIIDVVERHSKQRHVPTGQSTSDAGEQDGDQNLPM